MPDSTLEFLSKNGLNLLTLALVLVSLFKDQIRSFVQSRLDLATKQKEQEASVEAQAWKRVFQNGMRADGYVERLLLQQEHHMSQMRERDAHIERLATITVEAVRDAVEVMDSAMQQQRASNKATVAMLTQFEQTLISLREHTAAMGVVVSLYLHDRQGVTWEELLAAVRKDGMIDQGEIPQTNKEA
jgi:adenine-specific DNA methylase